MVVINKQFQDYFGKKKKGEGKRSVSDIFISHFPRYCDAYCSLKLSTIEQQDDGLLMFLILIRLPESS